MAKWGENANLGSMMTIAYKDVECEQIGKFISSGQCFCEDFPQK